MGTLRCSSEVDVFRWGDREADGSVGISCRAFGSAELQRDGGEATVATSNHATSSRLLTRTAPPLSTIVAPELFKSEK